MNTKHDGIWTLFVLLVAWLLATFSGLSYAQTPVPEQRQHWELEVAEVDLDTLKIVAELPANHKDYTKDECFALKDVLDMQSGDGRYQLIFACVPTDKVDVSRGIK